MSPIRPSEKHRYPKNWPEIRAKILERAGNRCENCGALNGAIIWRDGDGYPWVLHPRAVEYVAMAIDGGETVRTVRIVLTVAHRDHRPENNDPENLRAWCQKCHLTYDAKHHARNARETRRAKKAVGDLFA